MAVLRQGDDVWAWIKQRYKELDEQRLYETIDPNDPQVRELTEILLDPDTPWAHVTASDKLWEATPGSGRGFFHIGSPAAAEHRSNARDDYLTSLENEVRRQLGNEEKPLEESLRTLPIELRNIDNIAWGVDNGLITPNDHLLAQRPLTGTLGDLEYGSPIVQQRPVVPEDQIREGFYGGPVAPGGHYVNDPGIMIPNTTTGDPAYQAAVDNVSKRYQDAGYDAVVYPNREEDYGSLSLYPVKRGTLFNKLTGENIYNVGGAAVLGGLLAPEGAEAADFSIDHLQQLDEYVPEPKVGAVTKFIADMATDFAGWREQVNKDLQENPVAALASIPIGAIEEVWAGTNLALEGWTALDKFIDQNDDVRRVDQLLDKSYEYKDKFGDFFTEQGFPESWRTVGGITGVGGVATKGAKKGADTLYDLYRLGL